MRELTVITRISKEAIKTAFDATAKRVDTDTGVGDTACASGSLAVGGVGSIAKSVGVDTCVRHILGALLCTFKVLLGHRGECGLRSNLLASVPLIGTAKSPRFVGFVHHELRPRVHAASAPLPGMNAQSRLLLQWHGTVDVL